MQFRTQIPIVKCDLPIDYNSQIMSLGSCFAENIGKKLDYFKFQNQVNPFGIIFNPISIEKLIERAINKIEFSESDIFFHNERWHCYEVHSDLSHSNATVFLKNLNQILESTYHQISKSTHLIITYGTSWVFRNQSTKSIVANCHKVPQNQFVKEILSIETIEQSIQNTIDVIKSVNPNCAFIFTISPVRHIKDGFVENQRSKAHLIAAIHETYSSKSTIHNYFPSYEIMMDELRDYRFYAEDMLHPNQVAIDYIWKRFSQAQISEACYPIMEEVDSIQKGQTHRPFNTDSDSHRKFIKNLQIKISRLQEKLPFIKF
jgi:hypothetical protein